MTKQEVKRVQEVLFRQYIGTKTDFAAIHRRTGIPVTTLRRYKAEPDIIPLGRLLEIATAINVEPADFQYMLTGKRPAVSRYA